MLKKERHFVRLKVSLDIQLTFELHDPLICGYFSIINIAVPHDPQLDEAAHMEGLL